MKFTLSWKKLCNCSIPQITIFPVRQSFEVYKNIPFSETIKSKSLFHSPLDFGFQLNSLNSLYDRPTNINDYSLTIDTFNPKRLNDYGEYSDFELTINRSN